ncbi:hypothetical protein NSU_0988 [Novosphingobium pentaromativorans US6-1]|uniref:Uncharacterized protein n=1 Tax=Novosphingobium pentaromativorans US6-1 TaxID=1088721 RepID=G6E9G7_9SPHN|nr:hypothetical protein NSU_0988 [Novosphingobium pentaromativorans US6-1]
MFAFYWLSVGQAGKESRGILPAIPAFTIPIAALLGFYSIDAV